MAMRTATPWWLAWAHLFALLVFLIAQRFLEPWDTLSSVTTWISAIAILGVVGVRAMAVMRTRDARRRVELTHFIATFGSVLAIVCYALSTDWGAGKLGMGDHWATAMEALCATFALASILPTVMIELVLGFARRERFDLAGESDDAVEYRRVREVGLSGLSVALGAAFLMATCSVAHQRNHRVDVSYFSTSAPGESTRKILDNTSEPVTVQLWFPNVNDVKDEVRNYFEELKGATNKIDIEEHDLEREPALAKENKVTAEGTIVMTRGEGDKAHAEKLEMDTDFDKARRPVKSTQTNHPSLRNLDGAVNATLMKLVREKRKAYLTVGHGEINDPDSIADPVKREQYPDVKASYVKAILQALNYEVKNLGDTEGLDSKIPDDATLVMVLGPVKPLNEDELNALDTYVKGGGNLLVALDPSGPEVTLGPLEQTLGVHFDATPIADDKNFIHRYGPQVARTTKVTNHPSMSSASRMNDNGLPLPIVGSLSDVGAAGGEGQIKRDYVITTEDTAFRDMNNDTAYNDGSEKRGKYNVAAAIEGPKVTGDDGKDKPSYRGLVFADRDFFSDVAVPAGDEVYVQAVGGPLVADAIRWVGGEEIFSGDIENENDVEIEQTNKQHQWWFLLMIIGGPLIVLGGGLAFTLPRRMASRTPAAKPAKTEKKP